MSIFSDCRGSGVEFKYKGMKRFYSFQLAKKIKEQKVLPIDDWTMDDWNNGIVEVYASNYRFEGWNATLDVDGETIVVGWGSYKYWTFWIGVILTSIVLCLWIWARIERKRGNDRN